MKTNFDFSIPQRQSLIGVVVLFTNTAQKSIRALFPLVLIFLFKKEEYNQLFVYGIIAMFVLLIAVIAFLRYWFFKFYIDKELQEFVIESGVFNKTKTTIQLHKIQKVDINQSLIQRIFNVHKLEIDTAGSSKKEASINAISQEMALDLKSRLIQNAQSFNSNVTSENFLEDKPKNFITIGLSSLFKIGLTANYVASFAYLVLFFSTISDNLRQIGKESLIDENIDKLNQFPLMKVLLVFFGLIILLILAINLVSTIIKYFNFTIKKNDNTFVLSYGLINLKNTIINPEKVQIVKLSQNYFQKKLNVNTIEIKQASSDEGRQKNKDKTKIPGCTNEEKIAILKLIINQLPKQESVLVPNIRKLLLSLFFYILIPIGIGLTFNSISNRLNIIESTVLTLLYVILVGTINWFSYKNYKLFPSKEFIVKQSGAWDIDKEIIEPHKIQAIKASQFFGKNTLNIGSVILYTAGGSVSFSTANYKEIKALVNYWLYQVEVSEKNWM
ncbi:MAG: PH domain-containing protein [Flavobacterium sp.]|nr:PH domain-containing protein [Flavobacterium sp.]